MSTKQKSGDDREKDFRQEDGIPNQAKKKPKAPKAGEDAKETPVDPGVETTEGTADDGETAAMDGPEALRQEIDRLNDQYLRLSADFDNYRKRMLREKEDWSRYASQSIMEKLLPVVDNFDVATQAVQNAGPEVTKVAQGFLMIYRQLTDILTQEGLTEIYALGEMFDPTLHEAVMTASLEKGQKDNQVIRVLRKGYRFKDNLLRPAMVQVAKD